MVIALTAPTAVGTWYALGSYEPDTIYDETGGYMWLEPNQELNTHVYLNVVPSNQETAVNPNVGALGSRMTPPARLSFEAFYGVWVDCNLDGYIGHAETALFEYRAELLPDNSPCPIASKGTPHGHLYSDTFAPADNWVSELLFIGPAGGADGNGDGFPDGRDGRKYNDPYTRVWGDHSLVGTQLQENQCTGLTDYPPGTFQQTGIMLNHADCYTDHRAFTAGDGVLSVFGMGYDDEHRDAQSFDQEGHPLNVNTLGHADHEESMVSVYDCADPREPVNTPAQDVQTPDGQEVVLGYVAPYVVLTDEDGDLEGSGLYWNQTTGSGEGDPRVITTNSSRRLPTTPSGANPDGSVAGTYADYTRGQGECAEDSEGASIYGFLETNDVDTTVHQKNTVSAVFRFYEEQRSGAGKRGNEFVFGPYPVMREQGIVIASGSRWWWDAPADGEPSLPPLVRSSDLEPEGGDYWTFYANMSSFTTELGLEYPGAIGTYGADWCQGQDTGVIKGFQCDPTEWYVAPDGTHLTAADSDRWQAEYLPIPGTEYHVRDVDCLDGTVARGSGVQASAAPLSTDGPCADATS